MPTPKIVVIASALLLAGCLESSRHAAEDLQQDASEAVAQGAEVLESAKEQAAQTGELAKEALGVMGATAQTAAQQARQGAAAARQWWDSAPDPRALLREAAEDRPAAKP